jgi:hypothetical protein
MNTIISNEYTIRSLSKGGFIVSPIYSYVPGQATGPLFAASTVDEALKFIKAQLAPKSK